MSLYLTKICVGRAQLDAFINGTLVASGRPAETGCTTQSASPTVTGPAGIFADVQVGDRFYVSGIATEFTVDAKTDDQTLTLNQNAGADNAGDTGTWRAYRGPRTDPADIAHMEVDTHAGPTYHLLVKVTSFG